MVPLVDAGDGIGAGTVIVDGAGEAEEEEGKILGAAALFGKQTGGEVGGGRGLEVEEGAEAGAAAVFETVEVARGCVRAGASAATAGGRERRGAYTDGRGTRNGVM